MLKGFFFIGWPKWLHSNNLSGYSIFFSCLWVGIGKQLTHYFIYENTHRGPNKGYGWSDSNPKAATSYS
jgi:hypothetical protein